MPPRKRFHEEEIVEVALSIVRAEGMAALTARAIADRMHASTMPIYSSTESMERLVKLLYLAAIEQFLKFFHRVRSGNVLLDVFLGQILFARDERHLFRFLFLNEDLYSFRDRAFLIFQEISTEYVMIYFPELKEGFSRTIDVGMQQLGFGMACSENFEFRLQEGRDNIAFYKSVFHSVFEEEIGQFEGLDPGRVFYIFDRAMGKIRKLLETELKL